MHTRGMVKEMADATHPWGMTRRTYDSLSSLCLALGLASIVGSIAVWSFLQGDPAHAERFGIFIGLWAPTFFILSNRFDRYADKAN